MTGFATIDWLILAGYLLGVLGVGIAVSRRRGSGTEFFLAGRGMPLWAVSISVLATALSAATFVGGPQQSYTSNLTYFSANVGGLLAVIVVATVFVPAYFRHGVTSIYEVLGHTCGPATQMAASGMFMIGRVFASGARLYMIALPFSLVAFGDIEPASLVTSIVLVTCIATVYTTVGGIRAVIWTDVLQAIVLVGTVGAALVILWNRLDLGIGEIAHTLRHQPDGSKLRILDFSVALDRPYTVWTAIIGFTLFNVAAFGVDQDLAQRLLTCRSARSGAWSIIFANLLGWPVVMLFLVMGLLLFILYQHPEMIGGAAPASTPDDTRRVFLEFILNELPRGMPGLMMAGIFAAAMSSMDSALNAMASTTIADFYRPLRRRRHPAALEGDAAERRVSRVAVVVWAIVLAGFACLCILWQRAAEQTLIDFALGVMVFAYAGLLGVFLSVLLARRGTAPSAIAALATGFLAVAMMDGRVWSAWAPALGIEFTLAFPWKMTIATALSMSVCMCGGPIPTRFRPDR